MEHSQGFNWKKFSHHKSGLSGAIIVAILIFLALVGPWVAPYEPAEADYDATLQGPSPAHWFGTDLYGRDILSRCIYGTRLSLGVGFLGVLGGAVGGIPLGLIAGYYGGWTATIIMRTMDIMLAFPGILLAIGIIAALGPGLGNVIIAIAVFGVPIFGRLVQGNVAALREAEFVEASRSVGARDFRIMARHILPNCLSSIVVMVSLRVAYAILIASSLSFLGLGIMPPTPEWGAMLSEGRQYLEIAPQISLFPGLAIVFSVLGFNLLGDGLNDTLNPKL